MTKIGSVVEEIFEKKTEVLRTLKKFRKRDTD